MNRLQWCVALAVAAGVTAGAHVAKAQALGEAATLGAGVSSAASGSGSALGNSLGRVMRSEGSRITSSGKSSNSGGVVNLHWSRAELERSAKTTRTQAKDKAKVQQDKKAKPDFVIFGADPPDADSGDTPAGRPMAARPSASQPKTSKVEGSSGKGGKH